MLINGEKYACEACVRGHRVSNCQHSDRPLQHINKKGRPVSQCQHCRAMRKSRSAHIKCDCGEKTSKCAHLKQTVEGHRETCCCNHGGRCTCAHKKEQPQLDTVPESDSDRESNQAQSAKSSVRRRRANTIHSDGMLSFDENGHHKPTHKNRVTQKCSPYQLNRVNSMHSASSLGNRSSDNLFGKSAGESRSAAAARSVGAREQRRVKSETASPLMASSPTFQQLNSQLPPLDLSGIEYPPYTANGTFDLFGGAGFSPDNDGPLFSAGFSAASVDWSHYNLGDVKAGEFAPSSYSQAGTQSFNGLFEFGSEPTPTLAGTTSTSGEVSEVDDNFIPGDIDFDGFNGASTDYMRQNQLMANGLNRIDYESFLKSTSNKYLPTPASLDDGGPIAGSAFSLVDDDPAFWAQNYNDGVATLADSPDGLPAGPFWDGH
jgi:hypothetical protein